MSHLDALSYEQAGAESQKILDGIKKKLGRVPNIYAALAHSPHALNGLLEFKKSLTGGVISDQEAEAIALVVAEDNHCEYCTAAHAAIAKMVGVSEEEVAGLIRGESNDSKIAALIKLAAEVSATRGRPSEEVIQSFFQAGYDDTALAEVIAHVALNLYTNYFNHIAEPKIDFPIH